MHEPDDTRERELPARIEQLLPMLESIAERHRRLLTLIEEKRQAIRDADIDAISETCERERAITEQLAEAEQRRLRLVGRITELLEPEAERPLPLRDIAERLDEPGRERLLECAEALREVLERVRRESSIVTAAAQALARHMSGIMQSVNGALSRVGIYERRGRIAVGSQLDYCIDMKS